MSRLHLLRSLLAILLIAGLVHIVAILMLPEAAPRNAYARVRDAVLPGVLTLASTGASSGTSTVSPTNTPAPILADLDPAFVNAVCLKPEGDAVVELAGRLAAPMWTVTVVDRAGRILSQVTRDLAGGDSLRMAVGSGEALDRLKAERAHAGSDTTAYVTADRAFLWVKALAPTRGDRPEIEAAVGALRCHAP